VLSNEYCSLLYCDLFSSGVKARAGNTRITNHIWSGGSQSQEGRSKLSNLAQKKADGMLHRCQMNTIYKFRGYLFAVAACVGATILSWISGALSSCFHLAIVICTLYGKRCRHLFGLPLHFVFCPSLPFASLPIRSRASGKMNTSAAALPMRYHKQSSSTIPMDDHSILPSANVVNIGTLFSDGF
jgi:hypothetical protein